MLSACHVGGWRSGVACNADKTGKAARQADNRKADGQQDTGIMRVFIAPALRQGQEWGAEAARCGQADKFGRCMKDSAHPGWQQWWSGGGSSAGGQHDEK